MKRASLAKVNTQKLESTQLAACSQQRANLKLLELEVIDQELLVVDGVLFIHAALSQQLHLFLVHG